MAEVSIPIPAELELQLEESGLDIPKVVQEALVSKLFERQLAKSKALQRAMFEVIASKSRLTEQGAQELTELINRGMVAELEKQVHGWN